MWCLTIRQTVLTRQESLPGAMRRSSFSWRGIGASVSEGRCQRGACKGAFVVFVPSGADCAGIEGGAMEQIIFGVRIPAEKGAAGADWNKL